jgi:hypothetical protein
MVTKRKRKRKDKIPYSKVRKPIPRPGVSMKDKTKYNRRKKHKGGKN